MVLPGEIRVLGRFSVRRDGREIEPSSFGGGLARTLVRILVTRRGEVVSRDLLIEALWPQTVPAEPNASLNVLVNRARRALGEPSPLVTGSGGYAFADDDGWTIDAELFRRSVDDGRALLAKGDSVGALVAFRAALDQWGGEALPEDAYAEWAQGYRATLRRAYQECLEGAAAAAVGAGAAGEAVVLGQQAVAADQLREAATLALVRALAAAGDQAGALAAFDSFRKRLADELGLDPSKEAFELEARVIRHEEVGVARRPIEPVRASTSIGLAFVGRDAELNDVVDALRANGVAFVAGRSGSGKSRLLAEAASRLDLPIVAARAFAPERDEPWGLARSLLREAFMLDPEAVATLAPRAAVALADIVPDIEQLRSLPSVTIDPASRSALAMHGAVQLLRAALPHGGVVVADDVQWADASSVAFLRLVREQVAGLYHLVAYRPEDVVADSAADNFTAGRVTVRLDALPHTAIGSLVSDAALAEVVAAETDGTPFAVVEVIRALWERSMLVPDADGSWRTTSGEAIVVARQTATAGQRRAVERRMEQHPSARRDLLCLLSLIGREVPARLLAAAIDDSEAAVLGDLDALTRSDLARLGPKGWATAHDLVRETVADGIETGRAAVLHAALARVLANDQADPAEVARHARNAGDSERAAEYFLRAAHQRLDRFAHDDAVTLATDGLGLGPEPASRALLLQACGEAKARRGDLPAARANFGEAMRIVADGPPRSLLLSRMAMLAFGAEDIVRADELVDAALVAAGIDAEARARALAAGALTDMNLERPERSDARANEALGLFEQVGDTRGVAEILDGRAMARFLSGDITGALEAFDRVARLFEDAGDFLRVVTPRSTRGHGLVFAAEPQMAMGDITEALDLARTLGVPEHEAYALWHRAEALSALGAIDDARASARESLTIAEAIGHRGWTTTAWRAIGIAEQAAGNLDDAASAFTRSLQLSDHLPLFATWAMARLALVRLAQGDLDSAEDLVTRALREGPGLARYEARLAHAELAAARCEPEAATIAADALALAEAGGHRASVERLTALAQRS